MSDLTDALAAFYMSQRIAVDAFDCPSQSDCDRGAAANGHSLLHGSEAHVGSRYGDPFRIVILSLSDIEGNARPSGREEYEQGLCVEWGLNPHLIGTQEILELMLSPEVVGRDVFRHFALTRAAKCARREGSGKPAPECFRRCRSFVVPELEILNHSLVITQGAEAWWVLEAKSEPVPDRLVKTLVAQDIATGHPAVALFEGRIREYVRLLRLDSRLVILLKLVHLSARQGRWKLMKALGIVGLLGWVTKRLITETAA